MMPHGLFATEVPHQINLYAGHGGNGDRTAMLS